MINITLKHHPLITISTFLLMQNHPIILLQIEKKILMSTQEIGAVVLGAVLTTCVPIAMLPQVKFFYEFSKSRLQTY
jgi:hypothetical protein